MECGTICDRARDPLGDPVADFGVTFAGLGIGLVLTGQPRAVLRLRRYQQSPASVTWFEIGTLIAGAAL
jgi:hypothetical protein